MARVDPMTKLSARALIKEYVLPETIIFTDDAGAFTGLGTLEQHYQHRRVITRKSLRCGETHTNTIDGFWSLVKRGIGGVYHSVSGSICSRIWTSIRSGTTARFRELIFSSLWSGLARWRLTSRARSVEKSNWVKTACSS